jgi:hypothetical protein
MMLHCVLSFHLQQILKGKRDDQHLFKALRKGDSICSLGHEDLIWVDLAFIVITIYQLGVFQHWEIWRQGDFTANFIIPKIKT